MADSSRETMDEVVERLRREGQTALADLFSEHRQRLRRMVEMRLDRRVAGRVDASDILQEAFVDASDQLENYLAHAAIPPFLWLRLMTGERLMATHRKHLGAQMRDAKREVPLKSASRPNVMSESLSFGISGRFTSPSGAAVRAEAHIRLREAVEALEPLDQEILSLRHFEELSNAEAAQELGIAPGTASKRYMRALERLRAAVEGIPDLSWNG